jgi:phage protein D
MIPLTNVRQPALRVLVNGAALDGAISAFVVSNAGYGGDRFTVCFALGLAESSAMVQQPALNVEIQAAVDGAWAQLLVGVADSLQVDAVRQIVTVEGRDLTALFIGAQTSETFANRTSSEIAQILAQRHGLTAAVTATSTLVGRYYESEHNKLTLNQYSGTTTEWDLLVWLAQQENFAVYVSGSRLTFGPSAAVVGPTLGLTPQSCVALQMNRSLLLAQGVTVQVKTWNSLQGDVYSGSAGLGGTASSGQNYVVLRPNLTATQAQQLAETMLAEINQHQWSIQATIPGELSLTPQGSVALSGTRTGFDGVYSIASIERSIDERGFMEVIRANAAPDLTGSMLNVQSLS